MSLKLGFIVESLSEQCPAKLIGQADLCIERLAPLHCAGPNELSFLASLQPKYQAQLSQTQAACVIVSPQVQDLAQQRGACVVVDDPYYYFAKVTQLWKRMHAPKTYSGIHPSAYVDPSAHVAVNAVIGPFACIEAHAVVAQGACVGAHSVLGVNARVGAHSHLAARVTLGADCSVGQRCVLHSGVVIGADGFGFALHADHWEKIEQLAAVRVGDDVEIGANTCIDRGSLQDTIIEDGVKLDNLVQIGHNVHVGAHTAMAGCVGVAGSARIGAHCTLGGGAIVLGHLTLADGVHISAASVVTRSIAKTGHYSGVFPIDDHVTWGKNAATLKQLASLRERLRILENS